MPTDQRQAGFEEAERLYPETYARWMQTPTQVEFPGGESFSRMKARVLDADGRVLRELGSAFLLRSESRETHRTPSGIEQRFIYCLFERVLGSGSKRS